MSKRLIICADGTWNDEDGTGGPTNVAKLHHALKSTFVEGAPQIICYVTGVGTRFRERLRGGAFGYGLSKNIKEAYRFLVEHYNENDELFFFGFSRGAYTVRSLAGFIRNSGLLKKQNIDRLDAAFELYRNRSNETHPNSDAATTFRQKYSYKPQIKFIGVWDTVGSLGVPLLRLRILGALNRLSSKDWQFHDTKLSSIVENAYHALAIHERRGTFVPTLWEQQAHSVGQILEQVWFPGVHCDVGGGYRSTDLSDASLLWMVDKAEKCGLEVRHDALNATLGVAPDPIGRLHNSYAFAFRVIDWLTLRFKGKTREFQDNPVYCASVSGSATDRFRLSTDTSWPESFISPLRASLTTTRAQMPSWYS